MATMDDYVSGHFMWNSHITYEVRCIELRVLQTWVLCSVNHFSEGGVNANHIVTCSPSLTENDSRLLKNSVGNRDGEWIFCRRKQEEVTLFFQVTRIRKIRKICEATGEEHHGSRICIISVVGSDGRQYQTALDRSRKILHIASSLSIFILRLSVSRITCFRWSLEQATINSKEKWLNRVYRKDMGELGEISWYLVYSKCMRDLIKDQDGTKICL